MTPRRHGGPELLCSWAPLGFCAPPQGHPLAFGGSWAPGSWAPLGDTWCLLAGFLWIPHDVLLLGGKGKCAVNMRFDVPRVHTIRTELIGLQKQKETCYMLHLFRWFTRDKQKPMSWRTLFSHVLTELLSHALAELFSSHVAALELI